MSNQFHGGNGHCVPTYDAVQESEAFKKIRAGLEEALDKAVRETNEQSKRAVEAMEKVCAGRKTP